MVSLEKTLRAAPNGFIKDKETTWHSGQHWTAGFEVSGKHHVVFRARFLPPRTSAQQPAGTGGGTRPLPKQPEGPVLIVALAVGGAAVRQHFLV